MSDTAQQGDGSSDKPSPSAYDPADARGAVVTMALAGDRHDYSTFDSPRGRTRSLGAKLDNSMLVPEVGTASDVALARCDLDMDRVGLRKRFALEFVAMLEDDARKLFQFDEDDFGEDDKSEAAALRPRAMSERRTSPRSQAAISRVIVSFLKSMVGTYILYTPKLFRNGGLAAGLVTLSVAAWVSCDNMIVLIRLAEKTGKNSYGQLGRVAFGKWGQLMVDVSLVLSQLSFCCGYFIYIALNVPSVLPVPRPGSRAAFLLTPDVLTALQLLVYIPMAWIRRLSYLALGMLFANVCMWLGLFLITAIDAKSIVEDGPGEVLLYNPDTFILFMGAVVTCFEGIGLVLPLRDSLDSHLQHKFPGVVRKAMFFLAIVFGVFGVMGYLAYGAEIQTFVTMNIPRGDPVGGLSVGLYCAAVMMSYPLQLFPAVKTLEGHLFGDLKHKSLPRKWLKNSMRAAIVICTAIVGRYAGNSFDNFAGLIGGFCAVPLALAYPSAFYLKILGSTMSTSVRLWTWAVLLFGSFAGVLCTWQSLSTWK